MSSAAEGGPATLRTLGGAVRVELDRIEGSRFVGDLVPAGDEESALAEVARVREEFPDASHHCWAYLLADGRSRSSDDGEPRDTAGAPMLAHLTGADVGDVVAVVTRWFGGTKLGRGGLVRAYGGAVGAALEAADIVERPVRTTLRLAHPYDLTAAVETVLAAHDATEVTAEYGARVTRTVAVAVTRADALRTAIVEATAGRVRADAGDEQEH